MKIDSAFAMFPDSNRSERAQAADTIQEFLVTQPGRHFGISLFVAVVAEIGLWHYDVAIWIHVIVPLLWIGYLIHYYALGILHELWEINDQLAGRKDEFRGVVSNRSDDRTSA